MHGENKKLLIQQFFYNQLQNDEERCPGGKFVIYF